MRLEGLGIVWAGVAGCWFVVATIWFALGNPFVGVLCLAAALLSSLTAYNVARRQ